MDGVSEAGIDSEFGVRHVDYETTVSSSTESSSVGRSSQLPDHKSCGFGSNALIDVPTVPRVNKGGAIRDNGSLPRVVTSRLPMMRRSASSDAILSSYLYGRWPRLDTLNADYYTKMHPRAFQELRLQPRPFAETVGANSVLDQGVLEDIGVQTNRPLSRCIPATKSASWTECANAFRDTSNAVILTNNQDFSGNERVLSSSLEIDELCNQEIDALLSHTEVVSCGKLDQHSDEVDGHRAPLADQLNQLSLSADCCRSMHFVTICDSECDSSSDSDTSNEHGSVSDECIDTAAADVASPPAVGIATAVSIPAAGSSLARDVSCKAAKERCRVQCSPVLCDTLNSSPTSSLARSGCGSAVQTPSAGSHCQHTCTGAKHSVIAVKSVCRPAPEGCESKASVLEQQYKMTSIIPSQQSAFVRPHYSAPTALSC